MFKVMESDIEITLTPPRIVRFRWNQIWYIFLPRYKCSRSKVKGQGHSVKLGISSKMV